jgi:branched-chain amino acid aminotransferase
MAPSAYDGGVMTAPHTRAFMNQRIVNLNGQFVAESQARLSIYDSGVTMGDMAFEVTRTFHHRPFRLRQHLERLFHSLAAIRVEAGVSLDEIESLTLETLERNLPTEPAEVDWNIIHNVSRGPAAAFIEAISPADARPTVAISCFPLTRKLAALAPSYESGLDLVVPAQPAIGRELLDPTIKTRSRIHYHIANFQAHDVLPGAWAVLATPDGRVTEGTSGNFFMVRGGQLVTPPAEDVLSGITRGVILELACELEIATAERAVQLSEAAAADEMFLTSTSIGILHGRSFNQNSVSDGRIGLVTRRLRDALGRHVGLDFGDQARQYARMLGTSG